MRTCFGVGENGDPQYTLSSQHEHAICYAVDCRNASIDEINGTLQSKPNGGTSYNLNNCVLVLRPVDIIPRRLTPTECARLQGMPDWWCDDVPHADSAEYKMWGNGMALPCVMYIMEGVSEYLRSKEDEVC